MNLTHRTSQADARARSATPVRGKPAPPLPENFEAAYAQALRTTVGPKRKAPRQPAPCPTTLVLQQYDWPEGTLSVIADYLRDKYAINVHPNKIAYCLRNFVEPAGKAECVRKTRNGYIWRRV